MSKDPFERVAKKNPKIYFNDGETISCTWFDEKIGTEAGRDKLIAAIKVAQEAFRGAFNPRK